MESKPKIMMPKDEARRLQKEYQAASCILEFGSGGSTLLASRLGKRVFSVESDKEWADHVQSLLGPTAVVHHVDIGPTKRLGYPVGISNRARWIDYPTSVWNREDFVHPDLILVDGRFRAACFLYACSRVTRPTRLLFDDYEGRSEYHVVSKVAEKKGNFGRMGVFEIQPGSFDHTRSDLWNKVARQTL